MNTKVEAAIKQIESESRRLLNLIPESEHEQTTNESMAEGLDRAVELLKKVLDANEEYVGIAAYDQTNSDIELYLATVPSGLNEAEIKNMLAKEMLKDDLEYEAEQVRSAKRVYRLDGKGYQLTK